MLSANSIEDQQKKSSPKFERVISPNLIEYPQKKGLHRDLRFSSEISALSIKNSAGIWDFLVLTATFCLIV